jgi:hypothetical protein
VALEAKRKADGEPDGPVEIKLGSIIGHAFGSETKTQTDSKTGEARTSILVVGDFVATSFITGEQKESVGFYLPSFFAKLVAEQIGKEPGGALFAVNIGIELTNANIPTAWTVERIQGRDPESPMARLQRELREKGLLGTAYVPPPALGYAGGGDVIEGDAETTETVEGEAGEAGDQATGGKGKKGRAKAA